MTRMYTGLMYQDPVKAFESGNLQAARTAFENAADAVEKILNITGEPKTQENYVSAARLYHAMCTKFTETLVK
jgi:hypothetical protein